MRLCYSIGFKYPAIQFYSVKVMPGRKPLPKHIEAEVKRLKEKMMVERLAKERIAEEAALQKEADLLPRHIESLMNTLRNELGRASLAATGYKRLELRGVSKFAPSRLLQRPLGISFVSKYHKAVPLDTAEIEKNVEDLTKRLRAAKEMLGRLKKEGVDVSATEGKIESFLERVKELKEKEKKEKKKLLSPAEERMAEILKTL